MKDKFQKQLAKPSNPLASFILGVIALCLLVLGIVGFLLGEMESGAAFMSMGLVLGAIAMLV